MNQTAAAVCPLLAGPNAHAHAHAHGHAAYEQ